MWTRERVAERLATLQTTTTEDTTMPDPITPSPALVALERLRAARWELMAAVAGELELRSDVRAELERLLPPAFDAIADADAVLDSELVLMPDGEEERPATPWRQSAAAWHAPAELVRALEVVLRNAGSMGAHPSNRERASLAHHLERLAEELERHRTYPGAFDERSLMHHAVGAAVLLRLADAGSEDHLRAYGVEPEAGDE